MKRNQKRTKRRSNSLRVWTYAEARTVLPFVTSVMGSLREHWLAAQGHDQRARRLADLPGRPTRDRLLAAKDETDATAAAKERFETAASELHDLDVFCTDPIRGEAVIPFVHNDQLAWFVYDLFAPDDFRFWRYHTDPIDTRRPIAEALENDAPRVA
jgi:hypothetical protein